MSLASVNLERLLGIDQAFQGGDMVAWARGGPLDMQSSVVGLLSCAQGRVANIYWRSRLDGDPEERGPSADASPLISHQADREATDNKTREPGAESVTLSERMYQTTGHTGKMQYERGNALHPVNGRKQK